MATLPHPSSSPRVSVCIPVFNGAAYIAHAIESVLAQTYRDFELLVLDNASTDGTAALARRYENHGVRVLASDQNRGAAANWNRALAESSGSLIKLLCADDYLYPTCLDMQVSAFAPGVVMVCSSRDIVDAEGRRKMIRGLAGPRRLTGTDAQRRLARAGSNLLGETSSALFDLDAARRAGGFSLKDTYVIDLEFYLRLLNHGDAVIVPGPLSAYRVSRDSWSTSVASRQARDFHDAVAEFRRSSPGQLRRTDVVVGSAAALVNQCARAVYYRVFA